MLERGSNNSNHFIVSNKGLIVNTTHMSSPYCVAHNTQQLEKAPRSDQADLFATGPSLDNIGFDLA